MHFTALQHQRSNTSIACQECKRRKSKCTGYPAPCVQCKEKHTTCHFQLEGDQRRRESRRNFRACKTLLDFAQSVRDGDLAISKELYQVILQTDLSGKLGQVGQMYADAIGMNISLLGEPVAQDHNTRQIHPEHKLSSTNLSKAVSSETAIEDFSFNASPLEELPEVPTELSLQELMIRSLKQQQVEACDGDIWNTSTFNDLHILWAKIHKGNFPTSITEDAVPELICDWLPYHLRSDDFLTRSILSFTEAARKKIFSSTDVSKLIETSIPRLNNFFRSSPTPSHEHTAWSWACQLAHTFPDLSLPLRLAMMYISGMLMRFFIHPCTETYDDLPVMLKPSNFKPQTISPCDIETVHPATTTNHLTTKSFFFGHRDQHGNSIQAPVSASLNVNSEQIQSLNWPYSDSACLAYHSGVGSSSYVTLSKAFMEHIQIPGNYFIGLGGILGSITPYTPMEC